MILLRRGLLILYGPAVFLFIILAPYFCAGRRGFRGWYWRTIKRACGWFLWGLSVEVRISAADRAALAADQGSVLAVNHRSHLDGFALMVALPDEKWVTFGAKAELCANLLLRRGFASAGIARIDRSDGKGALASLTEAVQAMPARRSLILFPEGTRARDGGVAPLKAGVVIVAEAAGRAILPVSIGASDILLPRGAFWPRPGRVEISVLLPFLPTGPEETAADLLTLHGLMEAAFRAQQGAAP